jgi:phage terminase large subunit-like protein
MATRTQRKTSSRDLASPVDATTAYARAVVAGEIIAGPPVRAACARHLRDLETGPARGLSWHPELADRIFEFFWTVLRLNGGEHESKPFDLLLWQQFVVGSLFGWLGPDGYRRFRVAFVLTGKGSGKSPLAAGIGMAMFVADGEPRAEIYSAAAKKDQAMILFRDAVAMVDQSPALDSRLVKSGGNPVWNLAYLRTGSFFRPISSDDSQSGPRPHCALLDEIHEHKSDNVVEMMRAGTKGRRQALIFMITNAGFDRQSVCFDRYQYGIKVADGDVEDDTFFSYICALEPGEDPITDEADPELGYPRSWARVNPSIGVTFQPKYLEEQVREARGMPSKESLVRRLNFCEWVDAENPWVNGELWKACEKDELPESENSDFFLALDLSSRLDLTAAARVYRAADGTLGAELRFWTPKDTLQDRERVDQAPYSAWVRQGFLIAVPGRSIDYGFVIRDISDWLIGSRACAFDQWRIADFLRELDRTGIEAWVHDSDMIVGQGLQLVRHGQGFGGGASPTTLWMPRSITALETRVLAGTLRVKRNPVLTWNSASAVLAMDPADNKKWEKRKSTGRIDGIVALCMAIGLADSHVLVEMPEYTIHFVGADA